MYEMDHNEVEAITSLILKKQLFRNQGENAITQCSTFESNFSKYLNSKHSLLVTSGTNALICALKACNVKANDEVIIPTYTFFGTVAAITNLGAIPIFADIDSTLSICPIDTEKKITNKTKAIILVHMNGYSCDINAFLNISKKFNIKLIEDVAQSIGGSYQGKKLGTFASLGCYSFNQDKIITAGEGGAIITDDQDLHIKNIVTQDASCILGPTFKNQINKIPEEIGQSMRVSEITGALLNVQLNRLDKIISTLNTNRSLIKNILIKNNFDCIESHNELGNCGTSLYVKFNSPEESLHFFKLLNTNQIKTYPILSKPGHNPKYWIELLNNHFQSKRYNMAMFINSWEILNSTIKIEIPYEQELMNKFDNIIFN